MKKVIIAGGSGFLGTHLTQKLKSKSYIVSIVSRNPDKARESLPIADEFLYWDGKSLGEWTNALENSHAIINLTGASIAGHRWSDKYKKIIIESRIKPTKILAEAILKSDNPPKVFISNSAVGIYGSRGDEILSEESALGNDFLARLCNEWEKEALKAKSTTRVITPRIGVVLDKNGGALKKMLTPYKFFIGGPIGSGKQWMPWIHIEDLIDMFIWAIENQNVEGALNFVSPNPVIMNEFAKTLAKVLNRPSFFKVPSFIIKAIFGESASVILGSSRVISDKTTQLGYKFKFDRLELAFRDILKRNLTPGPLRRRGE
jgi:uncharacterized protein